MPPRLLCFLCLLLATLTQACLPACRFTFCDGPTTISFSSPADTSVTSPICLNRRKIGVVNTGEARVSQFSAAHFRPISRLPLPALQQPFTPHFFKAYADTGVGHETVHTNQASFLAGSCVALPLHEYHMLDDSGFVVDNVALSRERPLVDCVSFRITGVPKTPPPNGGSHGGGSIGDDSDQVHHGRPPVTPPPQGSGGPPSPEPTAPPIGPIVPPIVPPIDASIEPSVEPIFDPSVDPSSPPIDLPIGVTLEPSVLPESSTDEPPLVVPSLDPSTPAPPIPEFVNTNDTIEFPPTTALNDNTSFKLKITVSPESGSSKEDFYLLSDATGSMGTAIEEAKSGFLEVVKARQAASTDVAFGVGFYRDELSEPNFSNLQPLTKNIGAVEAAIGELTAEGGMDIPEANLLALYKIATDENIGWREGSRKIVVYFGDAVGHEPSCVAGLVLRRDNVVAALHGKGITVVATSFSGDGLNNAPTDFECDASESPAPEDEGQADAITEGTGGQVVDSEDQTELIQKILGSVGSLSQALESDVSDCTDKGVTVTFDEELPLEIDAGDTVTVEESVAASVCGPGTAGALSCMVKFSLGGADLGTQTLVFSELVGC